MKCPPTSPIYCHVNGHESLLIYQAVVNKLMGTAIIVLAEQLLIWDEIIVLGG